MLKVVHGERAKAVDNEVLAQQILRGKFDETVRIEVTMEIGGRLM